MPERISHIDLLGLFKRSPARIVAFFRAKGYTFSFSWRDVWQAEHARAFTVAKAMTDDILEILRSGVDAAIVDGWSRRRFQTEMARELKAAGWWGKLDPEVPAELKILRSLGLGDVEEAVQLGSPWRLKTIYRTNTSTAFSRGRYSTQRGSTKRRPLWMYDARNDSLTRDSHRELDNRVYRHDDPVWSSIYPPNGFNCRCVVLALTEKEVADRGLRITNGAESPALEGFPDEGWNYNPGAETLEAFEERVKRPPVPNRPVIRRPGPGG